jgi:hypothetical protein
MQVQAAVVDSEVLIGLQSAKDWLIKTCKQSGLQSKIVREQPGSLVTNVTSVMASNHNRVDKFKNMVRVAVAGFKMSEDWKCVRSDHDMWVFHSSDGKWKVIIRDQYNGSGGWKVATLKLGIQISSLWQI